MNIAIIPARGGSKRIPDKNIKLFAGKPIIAYSISAALESGIFDRVIVSTDSEKIAHIAEQYGAEIPFLRSETLSDDYTGTDAVVLDALERISKDGVIIDFVCCIYATAPFLQPDDLQKGFTLLGKSNADSAFTVTSFPYPIFRSLNVDKEGCLRMIWPEYRAVRSQDLPEAVHDAGQYYIAKADRFKEKHTFWTDNTIPIHLPRQRVQDIDSMEDWEIAERMYKAQDSFDRRQQ